MVEPTWKQPKVDSFLKAIGMDRHAALGEQRCLSAPIGCGRPVTQEEILTWPVDTAREYRITGWCRDCQRTAFADPDADPEGECTCETPCCEVDIEIGVMTCGSQHCLVHGNASESEPGFGYWSEGDYS